MSKCPLNLEAAKRLIRVAEWLEAGAPHVTLASGMQTAAFNMSYGLRVTEGCGTVCCIAGAVVQFNDPPSKELLRANLSDNYEVSWSMVVHRAYELLGAYSLDAYEGSVLNSLFRSGISDNAWISPAIAAKVIRQYLEDGTVDWKQHKPEDWQAPYECRSSAYPKPVEFLAELKEQDEQ